MKKILLAIILFLLGVYSGQMLTVYSHGQEDIDVMYHEIKPREIIVQRTDSSIKIWYDKELLTVQKLK